MEFPNRTAHAQCSVVAVATGASCYRPPADCRWKTHVARRTHRQLDEQRRGCARPTFDLLLASFFRFLYTSVSIASSAAPVGWILVWITFHRC